MPSRRAVVLLFVPMLACGGTAETDAGVDAGRLDAGPGVVCTFEPGPDEALSEPRAYTPRWAFEPWISKDISDRDDTFAFVQGFADRDIPVGVLVIDSPWDAQYTTFVPNPSRYPDFADMVTEMHARDIRVVMWVTQMVNRLSFDAEVGGDVYIGAAPNYTEGCACGYFVNECQVYMWWKGMGSGIDFFSEGARQWWHRQQDPLLDMGIDGWKLDFGESYMEEDPIVSAEAGEVPFQSYSEAYYRDYLAYGRSRRGDDFVTMVRPYDVSYDRNARFHARPEHAPVAWVGDNHRDWGGLADALDHIFRSATADYVVVGSDIGGYLDRDQDRLTQLIPFDIEVFQRWVALGAMTPFMQLHGRQNLEPWAVPERADETIALYRYWATLHHEMVPFWFSATEEAYAAGTALLHPQGVESEWPDDYRFVIAEHFLVAPILGPGDARDVALPEGRWYDWWDLAADPVSGPTTLSAVAVPERQRIPLYVREGAILPMEIDSDVTGLADASHAGALTVLAWPSTSETRFVLHEEDEATTELRLTADTMSLSRVTRTTWLRIRMATAPSAVSANGSALTERADHATLAAADDGWAYDLAARALWVKLGPSPDPVSVETTP